MNRLDRLLGIILHLRQGKTISAADLAAEFEVSPRTVYRDVETLSILGVPVYAERGREGGFRLLEGYFLPPVMFSREEATSLVLSLTLMRSLRARPFGAALSTAEAKLIAAVPDNLRAALAHASELVAFEQLPTDIFHAERPAVQPPDPESESSHATAFMSALLERRCARVRYASPYAEGEQDFLMEPLGLLWDRDHWYLVGRDVGAAAPGDVRMMRADRVRGILAQEMLPRHDSAFDVRSLLGRSWLQGAMALWREGSPVRLRLTPEQAARLHEDWYYRHALYEEEPSGAVIMTFGEDDPQHVLALVRWLGPGAELLEPHAWRALLRDELSRLLASHAD